MTHEAVNMSNLGREGTCLPSILVQVTPPVQDDLFGAYPEHSMSGTMPLTQLEETLRE